MDAISLAAIKQQQRAFNAVKVKRIEVRDDSGEPQIIIIGDRAVVTKNGRL